MNIDLPKHFFISNGVIEEAQTGKKDQIITPSSLSFFLILIKHREPSRELFIRLQTLSEYQEKYNESPFLPGIFDSLHGVDMTTTYSPDEHIIALAAITAARKAPEKLAFLVTPDEQKRFATIVIEKKYNVEMIATTELLKRCGIDHPLTKKFTSQMAKE